MQKKKRTNFWEELWNILSYKMHPVYLVTCLAQHAKVQVPHKLHEACAWNHFINGCYVKNAHVKCRYAVLLIPL